MARRTRLGAPGSSVCGADRARARAAGQELGSAVFEDHVGKPNVLKLVQYRDLDDLIGELDGKLLAPLEARAKKLRKRDTPS